MPLLVAPPRGDNVRPRLGEDAPPREGDEVRLKFRGACTCEVLDRIDCVKLALDLKDDDIVLARAAACRAGAAGAGAGTLSAPLGRGALGGVVRPELAAAFGGVVLPELAALVALLLGAAGMVGCQGGRL